MAGVKISALPAIAVPALTDVFPVVQGGVTYKETGTQLVALFGSSFLPLSSLPLSVLNGGTGVITGTGTGNTVLSTSPTFVTPVLGTITSGNLANGTGYLVSALADVAWTSFAGTIGAVGFAGALTVNTAKYKKIGRTVFIQIDIIGTSNSVLFEITGLPFTVSTEAFTPFSSCKDNGIFNICRAIIAPAGTTMQMILGTGAAINWTAANSKSFTGQFFYETS